MKNTVLKTAGLLPFVTFLTKVSALATLGRHRAKNDMTLVGILTLTLIAVIFPLTMTAQSDSYNFYTVTSVPAQSVNAIWYNSTFAILEDPYEATSTGPFSCGWPVFSSGTNPDMIVAVTFDPSASGTYSGSCSVKYIDENEGGQYITATLTLSGTYSVPITGLVNPKYVVVGITYAPPGPSSYVQYTGTTSVGNTVTIADSFSNDVGFSVSVMGGIKGWGVGGGVTGTSSTDYTQGSNSSTTTTFNKLTSIGYKTAGTGNAFSPIDSDYDTIWLWLNPVVLLTYIPATSETVAGIQWNGYGYDTTDPDGKEQPDVYPVLVGWLNGHFGNSPSIDAILARSWVSPTMVWATGTGPGLTSTDITNIIAADPLTGDYTLLDSFPSTTSDGRFTIMPGTNSPNPVPYTQAGPGNGGGLTTIYSTTQTNTKSVAGGTSHTFKQAFGIQEVFSGTPWGIDLKTTLSETDTLTWTHSWLNTLTTTTTLADGLSVTGPNCPAAPPGPCNPVYGGPGQFLLYQDNQFGTFLFYPSN